MQNIFIQFVDIAPLKGESTSAQGKDQIELKSFRHKVRMPLSAGEVSNTSRRYGRTAHEDFTFVKYVDQTSPSLNQYCSGGNNFAKVIATVYQAAEVGSDNAPIPYLQYTLENVIITSVEIHADGKDLPIESVTLSYTKITWAYKVQKQESPGDLVSGSTTASWNLATNAAA